MSEGVRTMSASYATPGSARHDFPLVLDVACRKYDSAAREAGRALDEIDRLRAENERLRVAVLDIDAHATPLGEDDDGFVSVGYAISVGCLHRALGIVGHSAPKGIAGVDLDADLIKMLYDLVPQAVGIPIGASALIWRAACELEAIATARPVCPTCRGRGEVVDPETGPGHCPACPDGRVPFAALVALWEAVHGDWVLDDEETAILAHLRKIGASR